MLQDQHHTIRWNSTLIEFSVPKVMGIVNCTPDSFHKDSRVDQNSVEARIDQQISEGASIIDIGGMSTKPGAEMISAEIEWERVLPALEIMKTKYPDVPVSLDTVHSEVAGKALDFNIAIVNDVSAGIHDSAMLSLIKESGVAFCMMHMKGTLETMHQEAHYEEIGAEVIQFLQKQLFKARQLGISDILIDPGFGFSKSLVQNYALLNRLQELQLLECPILIGISRKSMIKKVLDIETEQALNGTSVLHAFALERGANIIRVHDVAAAMECVKLFQALKQSELL